ncbi:transglutaminase superfamily protein [Branchiibius hedensis]|uniref:Transglutaminase-like superfamily protein n=2 Tax=Branchiibius hedensis TaxID=672460 RepID=A0A2Y8ZMC4_9MICO|nr:transglutaminase superfamily protein [Branchiibius hedensis]SSA33561.1 Transglutaminase-like superfamily protein [Branchiibius hedensis]
MLAAVATLIAAWPLTSLIEVGPWIWPIVALVVGVAALGIALRALRTPAALIPLLQLLLAVVAIMLIYLPHTLSPTVLVDAARALIEDGIHTVQVAAPPAPATVGLRFLIAFAVTGFALITDICAATLRAPVLAGVPLLGAFLISAANTAIGLNPVYFVALAALWLTMVATQHAQDLQRDVTVRTRALRPRTLESPLSGHGHAARLIAVPVIIAAALLPTVIPHASAHFFAQGLARGTGDGPVTIGFATDLDLSADLNSTNPSPVLTYSTSSLVTPPLRVTVTSTYRDGHWVPDEAVTSAVVSDNNTVLPVPGVTDADSRFTTASLKVTGSALASGFLAAPYPLRTANLNRDVWLFDERTGSVQPSGTVKDYSLTYRVLKDNQEPSDGERLDPEISEPALAVDQASQAAVRRTLAPLRASTQWETAKNIQNYLRSSGGFTYSLQLAQTRRDSDGQPLDPLSNFLATKQGYCTQFASAMVMMARADGIPARLAVGFLPGDPTGTANQYSVVQSDAHAWPELWFSGIGWTRFEPTPGIRATNAPGYTADQQTGVSRNAQPSEDDSDSSSAGATSGAASSSSAPVTPAGSSTANRAPAWLGWAGWLFAVIAIGGAGAVVLPILARRRRESVAVDRPAPQRVEAQWQQLVWDLSDLGASAPPPGSPRALERHYRNELHLSGDGQRALRQAVQTLEQARYAGSADDRLDLRQDAQELVHDVRRSASATMRLRAALWPRSAFFALRDAGVRVMRTPARWWADRRR